MIITPMLLSAALAFPHAKPRQATSPKLGPVIATWYGPHGFYWNKLGCASTKGNPKVYNPKMRGVAHKTLPCGSWVTLYFHGRKTQARVVDRGPFGAATFDATARTAMDLCGCGAPYTMYGVRWQRGRH